jgi:hypothetical protein
MDLLDKDKEISQKYRDKKISHYIVPYGDRPDIALLYSNEEVIKREMLDEH